MPPDPLGIVFEALSELTGAAVHSAGAVVALPCVFLPFLTLVFWSAAHLVRTAAERIAPAAYGAYAEGMAALRSGPAAYARAIAAFERTVVTTDSRFDRYARGDHGSLTPLEKEGLEIFNGKGHCTACHWGPYFSDGRFHNLGVPNPDPQKPDLGRYDVTKNPRDKGAFKTPTVRDAARRPPYLHNGSEKTLESLIEFYDRGGGKDPNLDPLMVPLGLSKHEKAALVAFIKSLDSLNPEVADVKPVDPRNLPR